MIKILGTGFFFALQAVNASADRDVDDEIFAGATGRALTGTVFAGFCGQNWSKAKINQGISVFVGAKDDVAAATTVTPVRSAFRNVYFMTKRDGTIAAVTGFQTNFSFIYKYILIII